jgi:hypothetical protein
LRERTKVRGAGAPQAMSTKQVLIILVGAVEIVFGVLGVIYLIIQTEFPFADGSVFIFTPAIIGLLFLTACGILTLMRKSYGWAVAGVITVAIAALYTWFIPFLIWSGA